VFYPIQVIGSLFSPDATQAILANPLSQVSDALRQVISTQSFLSIGSFGEVIGTSLILMFVGFICYRHVFAKVWELGKL